MKKESKAYRGNAQDIGCDVFLNHVMPIIRDASKQMPNKELAELYAGFFAGACGSMAADFGKEAAKAMVEALVDQFCDVVQELDTGMIQ